MSWQPELEELRERERLARELGGADKIKRQHDAGKLTIRERIDGLVDAGSFHEIGAIAGRAQYDEEGRLAELVPSAEPPRTVKSSPTTTTGRPSIWARPITQFDGTSSARRPSSSYCAMGRAQI